MITLIVNVETFHDCNTASELYMLLKYTYKLTASDIVALAQTGCHSNGFKLKSTTTKNSNHEKRVCVLLSGRITNEQAVLDFWKSQSSACVDFVAHMWNECVADLNGLPVDIIDSSEKNTPEIIKSFASGEDPSRFIFVGNRPFDLEHPIGRINSQLAGIAWCFAMAMVNCAFKGMDCYEGIVRCRLDYVPQGFCVNSFLLQKKLANDEIVCFTYPTNPHWVVDGFFYGSQASMQVVMLAFDSRDQFPSLFYIPVTQHRIINSLLRARMIHRPQSAVNYLVIKPDRDPRWSLIPNIKKFRTMNYTPERIIQHLIITNNLRVLRFPSDKIILTSIWKDGTLCKMSRRGVWNPEL